MCPHISQGNKALHALQAAEDAVHEGKQQAAASAAMVTSLQVPPILCDYA